MMTVGTHVYCPRTSIVCLIFPLLSVPRSAKNMRNTANALRSATLETLRTVKLRITNASTNSVTIFCLVINKT